MTTNRPKIAIYTAHETATFREMEQLLGMDIPGAVTFTDATLSWEDWEKPWLLRWSPNDPSKYWPGWKQAKPDRFLILTHSLIPQKPLPPADWRARGAAGEYEAHAIAYAQNLVAAGLGDSVIRLAHEANGDWYHHQVGNTVEDRRDWARFWARTVRAMRTVEGAAFRFDWNINAGYRPFPFDEYYPGDDVVDIIGVDQYDAIGGAKCTLRGRDRWRAISSQPGGLNDIIKFAQAHGRPLSIPEWGLVDDSQTQPGAGDNSHFVNMLVGAVKGIDLEYIAYFNQNTKGTLRLEEVPRAMGAWRTTMRELAATTAIQEQTR